MDHPSGMHGNLVEEGYRIVTSLSGGKRVEIGIEVVVIFVFYVLELAHHAVSDWRHQGFYPAFE